ncbi:MAG TPA: NAD(+) synthase [Vitreimonas sp.]|nr:NAD(+) synthase [Vitreimonas sp.]
MSLHLPHPRQTIAELVSFIRTTFQKQAKTTGVIAVSGGIDSALSLTLLTQAIGPAHVRPVFLPYGEQAVADSHSVAKFNHIPVAQWHEINIQAMVEVCVESLSKATDEELDHFRRGNIMARCRMIVTFDLAKKYQALVCGTENKSEHYLGYFTRFGDAASDLEPIAGLYKTQVRQLAEYLELPVSIQTKSPSAELWAGQTDEAEMGFTYQQADQVLSVWEATNFETLSKKKLAVAGIDPAVVVKVVEQVTKMAFKNQVPYLPS